MTNATDALRALIAELARDVHYAIADDGLAPLSPPDNNAMREAIQRVLTPERIAALATPAGSASGEDAAHAAFYNLHELTQCRCHDAYKERGRRDPECNCDYREDVDALADEVRKERARAEAAEAEAARLRELVWWMDDRVFRWEGLSVSGYASKYACSDEDEAMTTRLDEVLSQQDAAMGSANGQG